MPSEEAAERDVFASVRTSQWRRRIALIVIALAAVLVVVLAAQSFVAEDRRKAEIIDARLEGQSTLELVISACNGENNEVDVDERADEVVLTVTTDDPVDGDACADGLTVDLAEPLADRRVVDGATGETVDLLPR